MSLKMARVLTIALAADIDNLKKGLKQGEDEIQGFGGKVGEFGKKAAAAFAVAAAAAAAYATHLAIDGVKAAIEDEAAQLRLANALKAATGATDDQIKATEQFILQTSLATGVADDKLRPAMQRLAVSTKDTGEAQKLLALALDISKGRGLELETVANALGRAQDGNTTALGRLGLGLSKAELATLSFSKVQEKLSDLYGGAAAANAETFQGKIDRLKVGFDEAKESLGVALLPQVEKFITFLNTTGVPALESFIAGLTGDDGLNNAFTETQRTAFAVGSAIATVARQIQGFITFLREAIGLIIGLTNEAIRAINIIKPGADIGYISNPSRVTGSLGMTSVPNTSALSSLGVSQQVTNNITVQAVDPEGAARAVAKVLNDSASRATPQLYNNGIRGG
jgi:hypothetical protein